MMLTSGLSEGNLEDSMKSTGWRWQQGDAVHPRHRYGLELMD